MQTSQQKSRHTNFMQAKYKHMQAKKITICKPKMDLLRSWIKTISQLSGSYNFEKMALQKLRTTYFEVIVSPYVGA